VRNGETFDELVRVARSVLDGFVAARLPADALVEVTDRLRAVSAILDEHRMSDEDLLGTHRPNAPGRGLLLLPPYRIDRIDRNGLEGVVTFPVHFLGGAATHGGALTLFFDQILGMMTNRVEGPVARTAWLKTTYRRIVPLDVPVRIEASLDSRDGRKRMASARLMLDGEVLTEAEGLFIQLNPGQA
jgi:acyl-coenzyme A thioesterase PaaI-like protein